MMCDSLKYLGYFDDSANAAQRRVSFPAAVNKMQYVTSALVRAGCVVLVVSASHTTDNRGYPGKMVQLSRNVSLKLFRTLPWGSKLRRVFSIVFSRASVFIWLLLNVQRGEPIIVYHSLGYARLVALAKRLVGFRLLLQVEEVYADVSGRRTDWASERSVFKRADGFLLSSWSLTRAVNPDGRPVIVAHGNYASEPRTGFRFGDDRIHVVYAGNFDPRKGGAAIALDAAQHLSDGYHLHIIGFGTDSEIRELLARMQLVSAQSACEVSYDGLLHGEEYVRFLQGCDIGITTQVAEGRYNETSFPSKLLSYLANDLHVVAVRLPVLEESAVADLIHFYEGEGQQGARALAAAIEAIDVAEPPVGGCRLEALDRAFVNDLRDLLNGR